MDLNLIRGKNVIQRLSEAHFRSKINHLYDRCPWATAYQSLEFNYAWYLSYYNRYDPLIVYREKNNELIGLGWFAQRRDNNELVVAGDHQSGYKMWLCLDDVEEFFNKMINLISTYYNFEKIDFSYLSQSIPLQWTKSCPIKRRVIVAPKELPLFNLNCENASAQINSKNRRYKYNKLFGIKGVKHKTYNNFSELEPILNDIIEIHDFRMGAVYGTCPFKIDENKRKFIEELSKTKIFFVSVIKKEAKIISFHIGFIDNYAYYPGFSGFFPLYSRVSPGYVHDTLVKKEAIKSNLSYIDYDPGNDPYKDKMKNEIGTAYKFILYNSCIKCFIKKFELKISETIKKIIAKNKIFRKSTWDFYKIRRAGINEILKEFLKKWTVKEKLICTYNHIGVDQIRISESDSLKENDIGDFLLPNNMKKKHADFWFMKQCFTNFTKEKISYSRSENGFLIFLAWCFISKKEHKTIHKDEYKNTLIISEIYIYKNKLKKKLFYRFIDEIICSELKKQKFEKVEIYLSPKINLSDDGIELTQ